MSLGFPNLLTPVLDGVRFSREWLGFMRELYVRLGQSSEAPMFHALSHGTVTSAGSSVITAFNRTIFLGNDQREKTALTPFGIWRPLSTGSGNVVLRLTIGTAGSGSVISTTTENKTVAAPGVSNQLVYTQFADVSASDTVKDSVVDATLLRVGSDAADTYGDNIQLLGIVLKRQRDGIGSAKAVE